MVNIRIRRYRSRLKNLIKFIFLNVPRLISFYVCGSPRGITSRKRLNRYTRIWQYSDLEILSFDIYRIARTDLYLAWQTICQQKRSTGHKAWELAVLVNYFQRFDNMKILDIGSGNSTFPVCLKKLGANVLTFDLFDQHALPLMWNVYKYKKYKIKRDYGDMLHLPYSDDSFDLVTSISVIEHVNEDPDEGFKVISNESFYERSRKSIQEMCRVAKEGGYIYITSDVFAPSYSELETGIYTHPQLLRNRPAYTVKEIRDIFLPTLFLNQFELIEPDDFSEETLERVISTDPNAPREWKRPFAILGRKTKQTK